MPRGGRAVDRPHLVVEQVMERTAVTEPGRREVGREGELGDGEVGLARVALEHQGIEGLAEHPAELAGTLEHPFGDDVGERDEVGEARLARAELGHDRTERRPVGGRGADQGHVAGAGPAGQGLVNGRVVVGDRVRHAPDDRQAIGQPGRQRQPVGDPEPGQARGDRIELAPDLARGVGLRVPQIEVAGTAVMEQQDHGADRSRRLAEGLGTEQPGEREGRGTHPQDPDPQQVAAAEECRRRRGNQAPWTRRTREETHQIAPLPNHGTAYHESNPKG